MIDRIAALELDVDYGTGTETARFEMGPLGTPEGGGASVEHEIRTDLFVDSRGDQLLSFLVDAVAQGEAKRQGLSLDFGGGVHAVTLNFNNPGSTRVDGSLLQWGTSADETSLDATTATGADPYQQQAVLFQALRVGTFDSVQPARLEVGEFGPGGQINDLGALEVVVENPNAVYGSDSPARWDGSITLAETQSLDDLGDALERSKLGGSN